MYDHETNAILKCIQRSKSNHGAPRRVTKETDFDNNKHL